MPDNRGYFGRFGGRFVPETLMPALEELTEVYNRIKEDETFQSELNDLLKNYAGRETPLYYRAASFRKPWRGTDFPKT